MHEKAISSSSLRLGQKVCPQWSQWSVSERLIGKQRAGNLAVLENNQPGGACEACRVDTPPAADLIYGLGKDLTEV